VETEAWEPWEGGGPGQNVYRKVGLWKMKDLVGKIQKGGVKGVGGTYRVESKCQGGKKKKGMGWGKSGKLLGGKRFTLALNY